MANNQSMTETNIAILVGCFGVVLIIMLIGLVYFLRVNGWCCFSKTSPNTGLNSDRLAADHLIINADPEAPTPMRPSHPVFVDTRERENRLITPSARRREQERFQAAAAGLLTGAVVRDDVHISSTSLQPLALHCLRNETPSDWQLPAEDMGDLTRGQAQQIANWTDTIHRGSTSTPLEPAVPDDPWYTTPNSRPAHSPRPYDSRSETMSVASSAEMYNASADRRGSPIVSDISETQGILRKPTATHGGGGGAAMKQLQLEPPVESV